MRELEESKITRVDRFDKSIFGLEVDEGYKSPTYTGLLLCGPSDQSELEVVLIEVHSGISTGRWVT